MLEAHRQHEFPVRLEWGPVGAAATAPVDVAVVVDVLSFTTTLSVAVERGIEVLPHPWRDERAESFAAEQGAVLAVSRSRGPVPAGLPTLSPASMLTTTARRVVLPSPNGSTIAFGLADSGATVVGGCLRNATAVGRWLAPQVAAGRTVAVIPAGERWPDGSLRPALEDLWGAGAVLAALGADGLSPEAAAARDAFLAVTDLPAALRGCASGRELAGCPGDVALAAELDASPVVPVLRDAVFLPA